MAARSQKPIPKKPFHNWILPDGSLWTLFYRINTDYLLRFPSYGDFEVSADGREVACHPAPGVPIETSQHLYLNQVRPLALSKLGKLVFHAAAIEIPNGAVAFVGSSGKGKSTLTASFAGNGYRFLTDDGLLLENDGSDYQVQPSHPAIRLWADSEAALVSPETETAPALPYTSKSKFLAGTHFPFCYEPRKLLKVYFLGDGSSKEVILQRMNGREAFIEWVKHSFLLDIEERHLLTSHFDALTKLAALPIHYHLDYPRDFNQLPKLRKLLIGHLEKREPANLPTMD